uniref:Uncharacterized protein n=1 Tax=Anguilla anguilla TaxID=7936 RepID=A0A0E9SDZ5_ANGAN
MSSVNTLVKIIRFYSAWTVNLLLRSFLSDVLLLQSSIMDRQLDFKVAGLNHRSVLF